MKITRFVLKYKTPPVQSFHTPDDMYVARDWTSGYPTRTTVMGAESYDSKEAAEKYLSHFRNELMMVEQTVEITDTPVD